MLRENLKTTRWNLLGSCRHRYPGYPSPSWKGVSGIHRRRPYLQVGLFLPPFQGHGQSRQSVPRGTPKGTPFPVRAKRWMEGVNSMGNLRVLAGIRYQALRPSSKISHIRGMVERLNRTFREEFWVYYEDEVDLVTMRFHLKRWTEEVYNRKRPHWSLGYRSPWEYLRDTGLVECPT
jgi:hypothetical protein